MREKSKVKDYDQFQLRLPPGMRDRIKAKADRSGMSMNEAMIWALDRAFPAPSTLDEKMSELIRLLAVLKGDDSYHMVDVLVDEVGDTINKISNYRVRTRPKFRDLVDERYQQILDEEAKRLRAEANQTDAE